MYGFCTWLLRTFISTVKQGDVLENIVHPTALCGCPRVGPHILTGGLCWLRSDVGYVPVMAGRGQRCPATCVAELDVITLRRFVARQIPPEESWTLNV